MPDDEADKMGMLRETLKERREQAVFPLLTPAEGFASPDAQAEAEDLSAFVRQIEHAEITSFIDNHRKDYFEFFHHRRPSSFKVCEAKWIRENYCALLRKFYLRKFPDHGTCAHLQKRKVHSNCGGCYAQ